MLIKNKERKAEERAGIQVEAAIGFLCFRNAGDSKPPPPRDTLSRDGRVAPGAVVPVSVL